MDSGLVAAGAVVVGALMSVMAAYVTARLSAKANLRLETERQRLADRREHREFQRQTLLDVLTELTTYGRVSFQVYQFDKNTYQSAKKFTQMPPELAARQYEVGVSFGLLIERVVDDGVRTALTAIHGADMRLVIPKSLLELEAGMAEFMSKFQRARELVGTELRSYLWDESDTPQDRA